LNHDAKRRRYMAQLEFEDAVGIAAQAYTKSIMDQLRAAETDGQGWPEKLTLASPVTKAETEAFNLVLANLEKELPAARITVSERR
jgi:fructose-1,6-bisphosphatase/inositol monophosphatase family enzyme